MQTGYVWQGQFQGGKHFFLLLFDVFGGVAEQLGSTQTCIFESLLGKVCSATIVAVFFEGGLRKTD